MYSFNRRYSGYRRFTGKGVVGDVVNIDFEVPDVVEGVYSWRTGSFKPGDPPASPSQSLTDGFGVKTPSESGNFLERLADRKRYIEEVQRAAFPAETQTGTVVPDRTSTTDSGHLFVSHKTHRYPYIGKLDLYYYSSYYYKGDIYGSVDSGLLNPSGINLGIPGEYSNGSISISDAVRQGIANRYFAATAPDRNDASLAVTVVELLRGDIPSVLRNFREMMAGMKNIRNFLGSDYLNIVFGWTPLIQEYANVIKVGMALDRAIYYESFRRKRQWEGPNMSGELGEDVLISYANTPYRAAGSQSKGSIGPASGHGANYKQHARWVESEDYHFSSKYTGLAKPSRRANSFNDQAMDVMKRLGVVDDPRLLWDLTPWSWLVDWFTTMGDSISNASVYAPISGKYTVDYAYLTTRRVRTVEGRLLKLSSLTQPYYTRSHSIQRATSAATSVTKWRNRATPFGFGLQLGDLSVSQYAILVALGLARSR